MSMTNGPNRILDEFAKLMTDAAGAAQSVRREAEGAMRAQFERFIQNMDLVQREEFEAMRDMLVKTRADNEALTARVAALEAQFGGGEASKSGKPAPKKPK
jgi:BMFP domain-containing protein YqiC